MSGAVLMKQYPPPPVCEREIWRYAGGKPTDGAAAELLAALLSETEDKLQYKVCYRELPVTAAAGVCDFGSFAVSSEKLSQNLSGCRRVLLFGATVGVEIDRLITRYGRLSPAKALLLQAIGAERIEALCNLFCEEYAAENGVFLRPRFSPGYGDVPLSVQTDIFRTLDCARKIGVSLNGSMLMSPSKSVTAFAGIDHTAAPRTAQTKCDRCTSRFCAFRSGISSEG